jgi:hypothetical protein
MDVRMMRVAEVNATDLWHVKKINPQSMVHLTILPESGGQIWENLFNKNSATALHASSTA